MTVYSAEKTMSFNSVVKPFKWVGMRLKNVNKGTLLNIDMSIDGPSDILLKNSKDYLNLSQSKPETYSLFKASTSDNLEFSIIIPETDNYYLIIDNRKWSEQRSFFINIRASLDIIPSKLTNTLKNKNSKPLSDKTKKINQQLSKMIRDLNKVFIFDEVKIQLSRCKSANVYSTNKQIFLCVEYIEKLWKELEETKTIQQLLLFSLMHEFAHVMLKQWNLPLSDNEEVTDEFATVIFVMFNQAEIANTQADYFSSHENELEAKKKLTTDSRYPASAQRARNIRRWIKSHDTIKKWQTMFVPRMQTVFLNKLKNKNLFWINHELVNDELLKRQ